MCGIAGVRKFGDTPITGEELVLLLCRLEHRGNHATGIAIENPDGLHVLKAAQPAWQFTESPEFQMFLAEHLTPETTTVLLHTRWATTGSPEDNKNNHPMFDGQTAIVHNGMISNHHTLFGQGKFTRSCETDSDIIRAIIDSNGLEEKGIRELCKMTGSAAVACVSTKYPGKLLLARSGSPLVYGFDKEGDKLYWASEAQAILQAARPFRKVRGAWVQDTKADISIGSMPDDTAWVFGREEIQFHHKFDTCSFYRAPDYSKGRESYHTKKSNWKRELKRQAYLSTPIPHGSGGFSPARPAVSTAPANALKGAVIKCPGCGLGNQNTDGVPWNKLVCHSKSCKTPLGD